MPLPVAVPAKASGRAAVFRRRLATTLMVAASLFSSVMTATIAGSSYGLNGVGSPWLVGFGFVLNAAAGVLLVWRYRWPWLVWGLAVAAPLLFITDGFAALCALVVLLRTGRARHVGAAVALTYLAAGVSLTWDAHRDDRYSALRIWNHPKEIADVVVPGWVPWLVAAVLVALTTGLGLLLRTSTALVAAEASRDRVSTERTELREEVVRAEERAQVARDIHDGLGNLLSRISLHAGSLQLRHEQTAAPVGPDVTATAELIWNTAHEAVDELRNVVTVLRDPAAAGPPGIDAIGDEVSTARRDGLHVVLTLDVAYPSPAAEVGHVAYRVVREALTNLRRYAPGEPAAVRVCAGPDIGVHVEVRNHLPAVRMPGVGTGTGLRGLAEAAVQVGGRCDAGSQGREFVVSARLPTQGVGGSR